MNVTGQNVFTLLKPICVQVVQKRDKHSVDNLHASLSKLSDEVVQELNAYVLFPLRVILVQQQKPKEDTLVATVQCFKCILSKTKLLDWALFKDIFNILAGLITKVEDGRLQPSGSEILKSCVFQALQSLIDITSQNLWKHLFHPNSIPLVGHIVSVCLSTIDTEKSKALKHVALSFLECLCLPSYYNSIEEKDLLKIMVGDFVASFMPRMLSSLSKVVVGDITQGKAQKCKAIVIITKLLKVTLGDEEFELVSDVHIDKAIPFEERLSSFRVERNQKWIQDISPKIEIIIHRISGACDHPDECVKMDILNFSHSLLMNCCKKTLKNSIGSLLKIPIKLLHSESEQISKQCRQQIEDVSLLLQKNADINTIIENQMFELCSILPNIASKTSDEVKLSHFSLLLGYIEVLKAQLPRVLSSFVHLSNLLKAVLFCFQMDFSDLHKIEEVLPVVGDYDNTVSLFFKGQSRHWLFRKSFTHLQNGKICEVLIKICRMLGCHGNIDIILDFLLTTYESESTCRAAVIVINEVLLGCMASHEISLLSSHVNNLLDVYTAPENWYLCTSAESVYLTTHHVKRLQSRLSLFNVSDKQGLSCTNLKTINSNVLLACLHLEAIATFSVVLCQEFRCNLMTALYPVLEKVSDRNHLISSCALNALKTISLSCAYKSVADLINDNADYLVSTISVQLRHLDLFPKSPAVLQAMLVHSDATVFPLIRDTIDEVLITMDYYHLENQRMFAILPVLLATVNAINIWFKPESHQPCLAQRETESKILVREKMSVQNIVSSLDEHYRNLNLANMKFQEEEILPDQAVEDVSKELPESFQESTNETEKEVADEVKVVDRILQHVYHLLANKNPKIRLTAMGIISAGIKCLSKEEDTLLPLVHKLWSPVVMRCSDPELQVVSKAFNVICIMGKYSGKFTRRRFTKDVLPRLLSFLSENSSQPTVGVSKTIHTHSVSFKLQRTFLEDLGPLLFQSEICNKDVEATARSCLGYLHSLHFNVLQSSAIKLFEYLIKIDPDFLWLFLSDVCSIRCSFHPPGSASKFNTISVGGTTSEKSPFFKNVMYLLSLC